MATNKKKHKCSGEPLSFLIFSKKVFNVFVFLFSFIITFAFFSIFPFFIFHVFSAAMRFGVAALADGLNLPTSSSAVWLVFHRYNVLKFFLKDGLKSLKRLLVPPDTCERMQSKARRVLGSRRRLGRAGHSWVSSRER